MTNSDWSVMALMLPSLVLFANVAADLSTSLFGRRVSSNAFRRLRSYEKEGLPGRSFAGGMFGLFLLTVSQFVPVVFLIDGVTRDRPVPLLAGTAEVIAAIAVVVVVARGTTADSVDDQSGPRHV